MQIVPVPKLGTPRVPLSHAVKSGSHVFVSGITPRSPDGKIVTGDFAAQMRQVMDNIKTILEAAGSSLDRVVKTNVILVRIEDFAEMNEIYKTYFKDGQYPARTTVGAALAGTATVNAFPVSPPA